MNKNISVWRGDKTPPTKYHLWQKEDGIIYVNITDEWKPLASITSIPELEEVITTLNNIKDIELVEVEPSNNNTLKSYKLKSGDNYFGVAIDIPKDKSIKDIKLGYANASVDKSTGEITIGTGNNPQFMIYSIALNDGSYKMISIDLSQFITEKEYGQGLELVNNSLQVKLDANSDSYLKVSNNGVKLDGVQDKFNDIDDSISNINNTLYTEFLTANIRYSPSYIENGINTAVTIMLSFSYSGESVIPDSLKVRAGFKTIEMTINDSGYYEGTINLSSNSTIRVQWTYKGISKEQNFEIKSIFPIYIGFGDENALESDIVIANNKYALKKLDNFIVVTALQNQYLYIYYPNIRKLDQNIPKLDSIRSNGIQIPLKSITSDTIDYNVYRSVSTFNAGNKKIELISQDFLTDNFADGIK